MVAKAAALFLRVVDFSEASVFRNRLKRSVYVPHLQFSPVSFTSDHCFSAFRSRSEQSEGDNRPAFRP